MIGIQGNAATCVPLRAPVGEKRAECVEEVVSQGRAGEKPWAENAQKEGRTGKVLLAIYGLCTGGFRCPRALAPTRGQ